MKTFNDIQQGDYIELDMRIKETQRHILQTMFISAEENKKMLERSMESALTSMDLVDTIKKAAQKAVEDAVSNYFGWGEGRQFIDKMIAELMRNIFGKNMGGK